MMVVNWMRAGYVVTGMLALAAAGMVGKQYVDECDSISSCSADKWGNPNFKIIGVGSYNYTDYDIYGVYLLPPDKSSLDHAAVGRGNHATSRDALRWNGPSAGAGLAWDYRWSTPRTFKVWWERVVDMNLYRTSGPYDEYTTKQTQPGIAWCEGEITVTRSPRKGQPSDLLLHFYPDGRVAGEIDFDSGPASRVEIDKRDELPRLSGRACLKEIPNPYYGRKRPISIH